jgi:YHS domain-containing protein
MEDYKEPEDEADIYSENSRSELVEDGEMSPEEEGFMEGFEGDGRQIACAECKRIIIDPDDAIETEINNEMYLFCSEECYAKFKAKHQGEDDDEDN